jgi:hypothetical protein
VRLVESGGLAEPGDGGVEVVAFAGVDAGGGVGVDGRVGRQWADGGCGLEGLGGEAAVG